MLYVIVKCVARSVTAPAALTDINKYISYVWCPFKVFVPLCVLHPFRFRVTGIVVRAVADIGTSWILSPVDSCPCTHSAEAWFG
jgi:hypothetical protein